MVWFWQQSGPCAHALSQHLAPASAASQVQKHVDQMQKAKEEAAIAKMAALMPHIGAVTRELALQECHWDAERALALLRKFALANADQLASVQKARRVW